MAEMYWKKYKKQMKSLEEGLVAKATTLTEHHMSQLGMQLDQWHSYTKMMEGTGSMNSLGELPKIALDVITATMSEDELMADNVQSFINMGILQMKYCNQVFVAKGDQMPPKILMKKNPLKKLLLLDMDETLLHAATLNDIYVQELYGKEAEPSFITNLASEDRCHLNGLELKMILYVMSLH